MANVLAHDILNLDSFFKNETPKPPIKGLYFRGDSNILKNHKMASIIGSRKPTEIGTNCAVKITKQLVKNGVATVSGLALGIDTIVHEETINQKGKTIAVLGTPVNKIYPKQNTELYHRILEKGLLLSQFDDLTPTRPSHFPMRNRTMAFLADATFICDASEKSGTKHQAKEALKLNKRVYILSHIIDEQKVVWANELISKGAIKLDLSKNKIPVI